MAQLVRRWMWIVVNDNPVFNSPRTHSKMTSSIFEKILSTSWAMEGLRSRSYVFVASRSVSRVQCSPSISSDRKDGIRHRQKNIDRNTWAAWYAIADRIKEIRNSTSHKSEIRCLTHGLDRRFKGCPFCFFFFLTWSDPRMKIHDPKKSK